MPKTSYKPTPADAATGARIRQLRKLAGETLNQTVERSGVSFGFGTLCRIENGARHISIPDAAKLAAHFNTTVDKVMIKPQMTLETALSAFQALRADSVDEDPATEQEWLGNETEKPALFAVDGPELTPEEVVKMKPFERQQGGWWEYGEEGKIWRAAPRTRLNSGFAIPDRSIMIDRDNPMTPDEYRDQVWIPYLEHRYNTDRKTA